MDLSLSSASSIIHDYLQLCGNLSNFDPTIRLYELLNLSILSGVVTSYGRPDLGSSSSELPPRLNSATHFSTVEYLGGEGGFLHINTCQALFYLCSSFSFLYKKPVDGAVLKVSHKVKFTDSHFKPFV